MKKASWKSKLEIILEQYSQRQRKMKNSTNFLKNLRKKIKTNGHL
jgi:hypothetical protein